MIVADTSVLIKQIVPEPRSDIARALRSEGLIAPSLWIAEAANVLWRKSMAGEFPAEEAVWRLGLLTAGGIQSVPIENLAEATLALSLELRHPVYDCFFLEAAIRENTYVVTDDSRFAAAVRKHGKRASRVRLLSEM